MKAPVAIRNGQVARDFDLLMGMPFLLVGLVAATAQQGGRRVLTAESIMDTFGLSARPGWFGQHLRDPNWWLTGGVGPDSGGPT